MQIITTPSYIKAHLLCSYRRMWTIRHLYFMNKSTKRLYRDKIKETIRATK